MKNKLVVPMLFVLALLAVPVAQADTVNTLYCTGGAACYSNVADAGSSYWILGSDISLGPSSTFTYELTVTAVNESSPGYLQDFSSQMFYGNGASVSNLAWVSGENPGSWADPSASKAGNSGSCNGSANGVVCGAADSGGSLVSLAGGPVIFGVTGNYAGTFLSDGAFTIQVGAAANPNGSGGNVLAVSQPVSGTVPVPEPGTLVLFGSGLLSIAGFLRKKVLG